MKSDFHNEVSSSHHHETKEESLIRLEQSYNDSKPLADVSQSQRQEEPCRFSRGEIIGGGVSGIVELSESGFAIKSPWPDSDASIDDLESEARIYKHLGSHPRLVHIHDWDAEQRVLIMEYMSRGNLKDYIETQDVSITLAQRRQWALQCAKGLEYLHSMNVIHHDFKPKNILLDSTLGVRIADFGCSSLLGSVPTGNAGVRYTPPQINVDGFYSDSFALGCTIYAIMTSHDPFSSVPSSQVPHLYRHQKFPDLSGVTLREVIKSCWKGTFKSVAEARQAIEDADSNLTISTS